MKQLESVETARRKARPTTPFKINLAPLPKSSIPKIKGRLRK